ncbi:oligosaccharide flippase family protein [Lysinibacillus sp. MHQ-1]|nr:oligosaccharide flippase family protein [Lysinibacillus sp. MHQ-1]
MKEIKIGAILSYLTIGCTMISSLLFTPLMISLLGQKEFGLYSLMIVLVGYLSILDLGLGNAIVRYIARNRAIADKALEASLNGFFLKLFISIGCLTLLIGFFPIFTGRDDFWTKLIRRSISQSQSNGLYNDH